MSRTSKDSGASMSLGNRIVAVCFKGPPRTSLMEQFVNNSFIQVCSDLEIQKDFNLENLKIQTNDFWIFLGYFWMHTNSTVFLTNVQFSEKSQELAVHSKTVGSSEELIPTWIPIWTVYFILSNTLIGAMWVYRCQVPYLLKPKLQTSSG